MADYLWDFCVSVYRDEEVAHYCLELQEQFQANVNFLLLCAWLAKQGQMATVDSFTRLLDTTMEWHRQTVLPLRKVRQDLKTQQATAPELEGLYLQLKAAELAAERWEVSRLQVALDSTDLQSGAASAFQYCFQGNLRNYARAAQLVEEFSLSTAFFGLLKALDTLA